MAELLLMSSAIAGLMGLSNLICSDPVRRRDPAYVGLASLCKVVAVLKTIPALVRPPACKQLTATRESQCSRGTWLSGEVLLGSWPATIPTASKPGCSSTSRTPPLTRRAVASISKNSPTSATQACATGNAAGSQENARAWDFLDPAFPVGQRVRSVRGQRS